MPQSLSFLLVHIVFSTKERRAFLREDVRGDLHAYLATVIRNAGCECYRVGGIADHVHLAVRLSRESTVSDLVRDTKRASSRWLKTRGLDDFAWQRGYAAFSVGPAHREALIQYVSEQESHHRKLSFEDELRGLLKRYGIEFDERYVWD